MSTSWRALGCVAALTLACSGAACASAGETAAPGTAAGQGRTCFNVLEITNLDPLPGPYLYIRMSNDEQYLLTLDRGSERLLKARNIQISPDYPRVCSDMRVPLTYHYEGHVGVYSIVGVERVKDRAQAEALAAERTPPPPEK